MKLARYDRVHKGVSGRPDAQVYHGRLYFGDANSGEVVWDCDCRPSDGALFGAASPQENFVHNVRLSWARAEHLLAAGWDDHCLEEAARLLLHRGRSMHEWSVPLWLQETARFPLLQYE